MPVWGLKWWQRSAVTTEGDFMSKAKSSKPVANKQRKSATRPASASKRSVKKSTPVAVSKKSITRTQGKIEKIIAMLRRPNGVSIGDLSKATNWQVHSVRGAMSGTIKKKHGLNVTSEKKGMVRLYRIADKTAG
jgi:hypothetical protein